VEKPEVNLARLTPLKGICSFLIILLPGIARCQAKSDSSLLAYNRVKELYFQALGPQLNLYNGFYYKGYQQYDNDEGQPYFESDLLNDGSVFYDGVLYENVPMMYDLIDDELIIDHKYAAVKLRVIREKVKSFDFNDHHFVYLSQTTSRVALPSGFYELLYDGGYKAYARWQKKRVEVTSLHEIQVRYEQKVQFYLVNERGYFPVKTKSSVLKVLKDKKQALQKFIRQQHLSFGEQCVESIPKLLSFYEGGL
jgi:hypothetical protein